MLVGWFVWFVGWFVGLLVGVLVGELVGESVGELVGELVGVSCAAALPAGSLVAGQSVGSRIRSPPPLIHILFEIRPILCPNLNTSFFWICGDFDAMCFFEF